MNIINVIFELADRKLRMLGFRHEFNHGWRVLLRHTVPAIRLHNDRVIAIVRIPDILVMRLRFITIIMIMRETVEIFLAQVMRNG